MVKFLPASRAESNDTTKNDTYRKKPVSYHQQETVRSLSGSNPKRRYLAFELFETCMRPVIIITRPVRNQHIHDDWFLIRVTVEMVQSVRMSTGCSIIPFVQDEKHFESFTQIRCIIKSVYFPFWAIDVAPNYKEVINFKNGPFRFKIAFSTDGNKKTPSERAPL